MDNEVFSDYRLDDPITNGVILRRDESGVHTNVPHLVTHHSPDGFEFGYAGSGPADLALNICELMLNRLGYHGECTQCWCGECFDLAWLIHQEFKRTFITRVHHGGGVIPYADIEAWVRQAMQKHIE